MAVYFMAFYILGGSLGPYVTGLLSDLFTRRAATAAGVSETTAAALGAVQGRRSSFRDVHRPGAEHCTYPNPVGSLENDHP